MLMLLILLLLNSVIPRIFAEDVCSIGETFEQSHKHVHNWNELFFTGDRLVFADQLSYSQNIQASCALNA